MSNGHASCTHCGEPAIHVLYNKEDTSLLTPFCCTGCRSVYNLINKSGLGQYYDIKKQGINLKEVNPVEFSDEVYLYLDDQDVLKEYIFAQTEDSYRIHFFLENVHCTACIWLLEKLPELYPAIIESRLQFAQSLLTIKVDKSAKLSEIASMLKNFGYRPHPLKKIEDILNHRKKEDRTTLMKIGVAGFAAMNIMLYSVGQYTGADPHFFKTFSHFIFYLSLPVVFYSATPFYEATWSAIKSKTWSMDIPIAIAVVVGFLDGTYKFLFDPLKENYLDTLSVLVCLLQLSRFVVKKLQQGEELNYLSGELLRVKTVKQINPDGSEIITPSEKIKSGDTIIIDQGDTIPFDGLLLSPDKATINTATLTGESLPRSIYASGELLCGHINQSGPLKMKVTHTGEQTKLGLMLKTVEDNAELKMDIATLADQRTKKLLIFVLFWALVLVLYFTFFKHNFADGFYRALGLIVITCPCASALATPLASTNGLKASLKKGIVVKNSKTLEKMAQAEHIYFDKTGTLTYGQFKLVKWENKTEEIVSICLALESISKHPLAISLTQHILSKEKFSKIPVVDHTEIIGQGVQGNYNNKFIELKGINRSLEGDIFAKELGLYMEGTLVSVITFEDVIRPNADHVINFFKKNHVAVAMISGDHLNIVQKVSEKLGITQFFANCLPGDKHKLVMNKKAIFVGDGVNDALSISQSFVGIALKGAVEMSLKNSDVYIATSRLEKIIDLYQISKVTLNTIKRNLRFSILFNSTGIILASLGLISPLVAAILMPLSSLTVVISTYFGKYQVLNIKGEQP